jgi:hypothetical protein
VIRICSWIGEFCVESCVWATRLSGLFAAVRLGGPKLKLARKNAVASIKANADRQAANVLPIIREIQKTGASTLRDLANALNARGISTPRGGKWYAASVRNVLSRPLDAAY